MKRLARYYPFAIRSIEWCLCGHQHATQTVCGKCKCVKFEIDNLRQ